MANAVIVLAPVTLTSQNSYTSGPLAIVGALQQLAVDVNLTSVTGNGAVIRLSRVGQDSAFYPLFTEPLPTVGPYTFKAGPWFDSIFFDSVQLDIFNDGNETLSGTVSITGRV